MSSYRSPSDFRGGKNLERALRTYSDAALLAQLAEAEASIAPLIDALGCEAFLQGVNSFGVRGKLEDAFCEKLRSGVLLATGSLEFAHPSLGRDWYSDRKIISPKQWFSLIPDFNDSTAKAGAGKKIYDILVFERSKLIAEATACTKSAVEAVALPLPQPLDTKPRPAVASSDFSKVLVDGQTLSFGPKQAKALSELYHASSSGNPWLAKNDLLQRAGSQLFSVKEAFRDKEWHLLIEEGRLEDGRQGHFRLRADISVSIPDRQTS